MTWKPASENNIENVSNYEAAISEAKIELDRLNTLIVIARQEHEEILLNKNEDIASRLKEIESLKQEAEILRQKSSDSLVDSANKEQYLKNEFDRIAKSQDALTDMRLKFDDNVKNKHDEIDARDQEHKEKLDAHQENESKLALMVEEVNKITAELLATKDQISKELIESNDRQNSLNVREQLCKDSEERNSLKASDISKKIADHIIERDLFNKDKNDLIKAQEDIKTQLDELVIQKQNLKDMLIEQKKIQFENKDKSDFLRAEEQRIKQQLESLENLKANMIKQGAG